MEYNVNIESGTTYMGKASARAKRVRIRKVPPPPGAAYEVTPERLAQAGAEHTSLVSATIEKAGQRALLTRQFADSHIDRLLRAKRITYAQWYAADWYRAIYELTGIGGRVTSRYDITCAGATGTSYGMASNDKQARARLRWREARKVLSEQMLGLIDNLVLHDIMPPFTGGRQRERYAARMGQALQPLAEWINAPDNGQPSKIAGN